MLATAQYLSRHVYADILFIIGYNESSARSSDYLYKSLHLNILAKHF